LNLNAELPEFGKWLYGRNKKPSLWLNRKIEGKLICEPINIIIRDNISESKEESKLLLYNLLKKAGLKIRWGHITPRYGVIDGVFYKHLPEKFFHSFSDQIWTKENSHGRFFGPAEKNGCYFYCGAVSKETGFTHKYISFSSARNKFSEMLGKVSGVSILGLVEMDNLLDDDIYSTDDHDGKAVLLTIA